MPAQVELERDTLVGKGVRVHVETFQTDDGRPYVHAAIVELPRDGEPEYVVSLLGVDEIKGVARALGRFLRDIGALEVK